MDEELISRSSSCSSEEIPESLFSDSLSMDSITHEPDIPDRIYVHQLNLTSADVFRRQKEKEMVEEQKRKVDEMKEIKRRQKEEEKKRDMEMLVSYNPWGRPGGGARVDDIKRKKFEELPEVALPSSPNDEDEENFMRKFGRPGNGAPNRTQSGRIRTQIAGDPSIRFQDTQHVRRSIENQLRYKNEDRENYKVNLDELIEIKRELQKKETELEQQQLDEMKEKYPFGKKNNNGGSYLSHTDPLFMATLPKQRREPVKEDFDPWGKGFGNPERDKRGNIRRHKFAPSAEEGIPEDQPQSRNLGMSLDIGKVKGGNGAPHITESGHPRTRLVNTLQNINSVGAISRDAPELQNHQYNPWGKPGAGAPFERENGKPFEEKMGWSLTGHPKKRTRGAKLQYKSDLDQEVNEKKQRENNERFSMQEGIVRIRPNQKTRLQQQPGIELASVIRQGVGGRPRKDPVTGEIARNPINISDVTSQQLDIRRVRSQESLIYHNELAQQAAEREQQKQQQKEIERAQSEKHITTWDSFWGRPGHGAPRDPENHKKENLNTLLLQPTEGGESYVKHYVAEVVPSKHKNRYDYSTKDAKTVIKKDYEFKTPWPAMEA